MPKQTPEQTPKYTPKVLEENYNITQGSRLKEFSKLLIGAIVFIGGFYLLLGLSINFFVPYLPITFENNVFPKYDCPAYQHPKQAETHKIFKELIQSMPKEDQKVNYSLCILKNKDINAFAAPGANIVLFSGLLDKAESNNEIAFVLAHELGHIQKRHHLKQMGRQLLHSIFISLFLDAQTSNVIQLVTGNTDNVFSRAQEKESDLFAIDLLMKTYQDATGALSFMKRIDTIIAGKKFFYYLSTHPMPENRQNYIQNHIQSYSK